MRDYCKTAKVVGKTRKTTDEFKRRPGDFRKRRKEKNIK